MVTHQIRFLMAAALLAVSMTAQARNVQRSECIGPARAPVKAIYMHGWFPPSGSDDYVALEQGNRAQLEDLARRLNIRIAVPIAEDINDKGYRSWGSHSMTTPASQALKGVEVKAAAACGAPLAVPRALIGFSNGGYFARRIAFQCDSYMRTTYSSIIVTGAPAFDQKTMSQYEQQRNGQSESYGSCPRLVTLSGDKDGVGACGPGSDAGKCGFQKMIDHYARLGGTGEQRTFEGGHVLPDPALLEGAIGRGEKDFIKPATPSSLKRGSR